MDHLDLKSIAGIAAATVVFIEVLKRVAYKYVKGHEMLISLALPILFAIGSKLAGNFRESSWVDLVVAALGASLGAGLIHDKISKVLSRKKEGKGES